MRLNKNEMIELSKYKNSLNDELKVVNKRTDFVNKTSSMNYPKELEDFVKNVENKYYIHLSDKTQANFRELKKAIWDLSLELKTSRITNIRSEVWIKETKEYFWGLLNEL